MRTNGLGPQAMLDESGDMEEEPSTPSDDTNSNETSSQRSLQKISNGGQKTAGDVLNDIGSMLADLTDELDAMLHMDPNKAN
jgi:hypothetical protein